MTKTTISQNRANNPEVTSQLQKVKAIIVELGFDIEKLPALNEYLNHLLASNEELNLISRQMTVQDLIENHVVDCFLPLKDFPKNLKKVADFGTGGGLPGVLYAIQFPQIQFSLYEKSQKKRQFLESCKEWAPNITVHADIPPGFAGVDLVIARAFKPIDVLLDMSRIYHSKGGAYFLLKGRKEKIEEEYLAAKKRFKDLKIEVVPLKSPLMEVERHLVKI